MAFQVSPGINVTERDLTTVVSAVSTSVAAIAGVFNWGPIEKPVLVSNEGQLVSLFGRPSDANFETFFSAANFLSYSSALYVSRASENAFNAVAATGAGPYSVLIKNEEAFENFVNTDNTIRYIAKYAGDLGNSLQVSEVKAPKEFSKSINLMSSSFNGINTATNIPNSNETYVRAVVGSNQVVVRLGRSDDTSNQRSFNALNDVNVTTDAITLGTGHGFVVNDRVVYTVGNGNTAIGGLTPGSEYFVISVTSTAVVLSTTLGGTKVELTAGNNESGHFLALAGTNGLSLSEAASYLSGLAGSITVGSKVLLSSNLVGNQKMTIRSISSVTQDVNGAQIVLTCNELFKLAGDVSMTTLNIEWQYADIVDSAPGASPYAVRNAGNSTPKNDEISIIVTDVDGKISGVPGTILEVFQNLSRATDARNEDGSNIFFKDAINLNSKYIYVPLAGSDQTLAQLSSLTNTDESRPTTIRFAFGANGLQEGGTIGVTGISVARMAAAYDVFRDSLATPLDISMIIAGKPIGQFGQAQLAKYLIDNIADLRKDCVVFVSPPKTQLVQDQVNTNIEFRNQLGSSSYAFMDTGYKYQMDKYNDKYRWVPLNGDMAGLTARTDNISDPWFSPAGVNRGVIKNCIKLWFNPDQTQRDLLYKNSINPVATFQGSGTILYGDKTLLSTPSAFDRINVRRLFIVLQKAIARAAQTSLFEFNDDFTRTQFKNLVEPFLREVQGRRGIYDFRVVCDETNNSGEVIDSNRFVGDIYIKPAKSINFIQLNFVAVRSNVEFSEVTNTQ